MSKEKFPKNKEIEAFVFDDKESDGLHVALVTKYQGGAANNRHNALLVKSDIEITDEVKSILSEINKSKTEGDPSGTLVNSQLNADSKEKVSQQEITKSKDIEDNDPMTPEQLAQLEKATSAIAELEKANARLAELEKAKSDSDAKVSEITAQLEKAKEAEATAQLEKSAELVKSYGFVIAEDIPAVACALIKAEINDPEGAKAIRGALEKAKMSVEAAITKEVGDQGKEIEGSSIKSAVSEILKAKRAKA